MSRNHVLEELSAYIDGEIRDPDRIARHLQSCPDCARRHMELLKVSAHVRALEAPRVSPAFSARLRDRFEEMPSRPPVFAFPRMAQLACAAALLLVAALAAFFGRPGQHATVETALVSPPPLHTEWRDDEHVVAEFARLMDAGVPLELFGDPAELEEEAAYEPISLDAVLEVLADDALETAGAEPEADEFEDVMGALIALDDDVLAELLQAYKEGV